MINRTVKCRVYPNKTQEKFFIDYLGACRFVYNHCLSETKYNYRIAKIFNAKKIPSINRSYFNSILSNLRKSYPFLEDFDINTLQASYDPLIIAFKRFFTENHKFPKFKSRKNPIQSVKLNNFYNRFRIINNQFYWKRLGYIKLRGFRDDFEGEISHIRFKLENNRWFLIINYHSPDLEELPKTGNNVGIDFGIKTFMTLSDGTVKAKPELDNINKKIIKTQRILARKKLHSKNYYKILKRLHKHINKKNDIINDYYHKISREIVEKYDIIKLETLGIRGMLSNPKFSHNIHDLAWLKIKTMIQYKAEWYGKQVIEVPRFFPSSQICSNCGYRYKDLTIYDRVWECPKCGKTHDRDINASINILNWKPP